LRHASLAATRPRAGRLQLYSRRLAAHGFLDLFADGRSPGALDADAEVHDIEVRTYYIARDSVERAGWPALRVKALTESRGAAQFRDEEVLPGVEDLQVEFAVLDPRATDGDLRVSYASGIFRRCASDVIAVACRAYAPIPEGLLTAHSAVCRHQFHNHVRWAVQRAPIERTVALRNEGWP
jgi:hypothetical protein